LHMQDQNKKEDALIANSSDYRPVYICFEDETINDVFSQLLEARGIRTLILDEISQAPADAKVVTEPRYFTSLPESCQSKCLIVGNKESLKAIQAVCLSRPLTEEKVEAALSQFVRI
jgi:hypothetical protein